MSGRPFAEIVPRGLIVSCQARPGSPLRDPRMMAAMARAAEAAGAVAIRANGPEDIAAIRAAVRLPVVGIHKVDHEGCEVRITPTFEAARPLALAGADVIAMDATPRPRPGPDDLGALIRRIHDEIGTLVMADVSTREEGLAATDFGADAVATTLAGYTRETAVGGEAPTGPDIALVAALAAALPVPVLGEGRYETPEQAREAMDCGAHAVVVGTAITRPDVMAARFVAAVRSALSKSPAP